MTVDIVHRGKQGDLIYSLAAIKGVAAQKGMVSLHLRRDPLGNFEDDQIGNVRDFVDSQSLFVKVASVSGDLPASVCLDFSDWLMNGRGNGSNLAVSACEYAGISTDFAHDRWLDIDVTPVDRTLVCWSGHYPSNDTDQFWRIALRKFPDAVFVGLPEEHLKFQERFELQIDHCPTENLHAAALEIAASTRIISDQNPQLAIAHGLFKDVIVEVSADAPDCIFLRANAAYPNTDEATLSTYGAICRERRL